MSTVKERSAGRPPGITYPRRVVVYENDEGVRLIQEAAASRGISAAALVRQLVREAARSGEERR